MGVETVPCPTCDAEVRIGLPRGSEVQTIKSEPERETAAGTKTRPLTCPNEHDFAVTFTVS